MIGDKADFFISFSKADRAWAEWIAWELEEEDLGYKAVFQPWDFRPGGNFALSMQRAAKKADRTLAVLSPDYLESLYSQAEWAAAFASDPDGTRGKLVPVRVREVQLEGLQLPINYIDLVGLDEEAARAELRSGLAPGRAKPRTRPYFPGSGRRLGGSPPAFPGSGRSAPAGTTPAAPATRVEAGLGRRIAAARWIRGRWTQRWAAAIVVLVVMLAGFAYWRHARTERERQAQIEHYQMLIAQSSLPSGLYDAQSHLDALTLGQSVISADWLSPRLGFLKLRRRARPSSATLRAPAIPWTQPALKLAGLPPDLVGLDISDLGPSFPDRVEEDALTTLAGLPAGLEYLNISYNDRLQSLDGMPQSLRSLSAIAKGINQISKVRSSALSCLDLGSPFLRSLRNQLPPTLRSLTLRGTGVTTLDGLPDALKSLEVFNNPDLKISGGLPSNLTALKMLSIDNTLLPSPDLLPSTLEDLHLGRTRLEKPKDAQAHPLERLRALSLDSVQVPDWTVVPQSLQYLSLIGAPLPPALPGGLKAFSYDASPPVRAVTLPPLPRSLETLRLSNVMVKDLRELPRWLSGLAITHSTLASIEGCPADLKRLDLRANRYIVKIERLPERLEQLNLLACTALREIAALPGSLRFLNIAGTSIAALPKLPPALEELDISGTAISSLRGLPQGLKILTLSPGRIRSLDGLPSTVRVLRFVDVPEDRAEVSHFTCEAAVPFERWPCLGPERATNKP